MCDTNSATPMKIKLWNVDSDVWRCLATLAFLIALHFPCGAQGIVHVQLPPSPSLGLVPNVETGMLFDPYAPYDPKGLRLIGGPNPSSTPVSYDLVLNGEVAFTFTSHGGNFTIDPKGTNRVVGIPGSNEGYPLSVGTFLGADLDLATCSWIGHDPVYGAVHLASSRDGLTIGDPPLTTGAFAGLASGYIGLEFFKNGKPFYGWVRIGAPFSNGGWIYEYAYQTTPNRPIMAGQLPYALVTISRMSDPRYLSLEWHSTLNGIYQVQYRE